MRKTWIATLALLFASVSGFAQTPSPAPLPAQALARILAQPAVTGSCATKSSGVLLAAKPVLGEKSSCTATAACETGTVTCNGNSSCTAVDRDCPFERGYVTCDGTTTVVCPTPCCNTGTPRQRACCRCSVTSDCWDCAFCEFGFYPPNAC
jgi:hypothetical protein